MERECPKCGSSEVIPSVRVIDRSDSGVQALSILIAEKPQAAVFRGWRKFALSARVCGTCGYTELYVSDPNGMRESHERASAASGSLAPVVGAAGPQVSQVLIVLAALSMALLVGLGALMVYFLASR